MKVHFSHHKHHKHGVTMLSFLIGFMHFFILPSLLFLQPVITGLLLNHLNEIGMLHLINL